MATMMTARLVFLKRWGLPWLAPRPPVRGAGASFGPTASRGSGSGADRAMSDGISLDYRQESRGTQSESVPHATRRSALL